METHMSEQEPFPGELRFGTDGKSDLVLADAPADELPSEGMNRNFNGRLVVGLIYAQKDRVVFETADTPEVFSVEQVGQILNHMKKFVVE
jgi:hypothetical protein